MMVVTEVVVVVRSRLFAYVVMKALVASVNSPLKAVSHVGLVVASVVVLGLVLVELPVVVLVVVVGLRLLSCSRAKGSGSPSRRLSTHQVVGLPLEDPVLL